MADGPNWPACLCSGGEQKDEHADDEQRDRRGEQVSRRVQHRNTSASPRGAGIGPPEASSALSGYTRLPYCQPWQTNASVPRRHDPYRMPPSSTKRRRRETNTSPPTDRRWPPLRFRLIPNRRSATPINRGRSPSTLGRCCAAPATTGPTPESQPPDADRADQSPPQPTLPAAIPFRRSLSHRRGGRLPLCLIDGRCNVVAGATARSALTVGGRPCI
jgi:hypothetical protein